MMDESKTDQFNFNVIGALGREESAPVEEDSGEQSAPKVTDEINAERMAPVPGGEGEGASEEIRNEPTIPVPRMYKEAAKILKRYESKESTLKNLVYNCKFKSFKMMYGLMCNAVENYSTIQTVLAECKILFEHPRFNPALAHVLTADLLASGHLEGDCKPILILNEYAEKIKELAGTLGFKAHVDEGKKMNPRYVRINTLLSNVDQVHSQLAQEGWMHIKYDQSKVTYDEFLDFIQNLDESYYLEDYHIPNLLIFRQGTNFSDNSLYKDHMIVLQDKACCLPVYLSSLRVGARVIDACAAPGNKASHMAAAMRNTGKIKAFDKVFKHYKLLLRYIAQRGVKCAVSTKRDFTQVYPDRHRDVEYIFIDPPCSSSGLNFKLDEETMGRVMELASVQLQLLVHALAFPSVKKVIYSTCSVNVEENEKVVEEALRQYHQFELEDLKQKLPGWKHFGDDKFACGGKCIRTISDVDKCQTFFVAIFVRKGNLHGRAEMAGGEAKTKRKWTAEVGCSNNQTHQQQQVEYQTHNQGQYTGHHQGHYPMQQKGHYPPQQEPYPTQQHQGQYPTRQQYPAQQQGPYQGQHQPPHRNHRQMPPQNPRQMQHHPSQHQTQFSGSWNYQTSSNEGYGWSNTDAAKRHKPNQD